MAIIIPSKNIFEKENPKIRDNILEKIEYKAKKYIEEERKNAVVSDEEFQDFSKITEEETHEKFAYDFNRPNGSYNRLVEAFAYIKIVPIYMSLGFIVNKYTNGRTIKELVKDDDGNYLSVSMKLTKRVGVANAKLNFGDLQFNSVGNFYDKYITEANIDTSTIKTNYGEDQYATNIESISGSYEYNQPNLTSQIGDNAVAVAESSYVDQTFLPNSYSYYENKYSFAPVKILCGVEIIKLGYGASIETANTSFQGTNLLPSTAEMSGESIKYLPLSVSIRVNGDYYTLSEEEIAFITGDVNSTNSQIVGEGNPLFQLSNYITRGNAVAVAGEQYYKDFTSTVLETNGYKNGKETATILCSISDYYDTSGEKMVSAEGLKNTEVSFTWDGTFMSDWYPNEKIVTCKLVITKGNISEGDKIHFKGGYIEFKTFSNSKWTCRIYGDSNYAIPILESGEASAELKCKMTFDLYDKVIPMTYGANGVDKPLSKYKDGSAKVFQVLGMRPIYDGAVWQELTLQETSQ
jgi:hypothetical protein